MTRTEAIESQIEEIMDNFDFRKIADYMERVKWRWRHKVPSQSEIRQKCRKRMLEMAQNGQEQSFSGGILIQFVENKAEKWLRFDLYFVLEWWPMDGTEYTD